MREGGTSLLDSSHVETWPGKPVLPKSIYLLRGPRKIELEMC